jgi:hypothetical protein
MALTLIRRKDHLRILPKPTGGKAAGTGLRFVIQKHDATIAL